MAHSIRRISRLLALWVLYLPASAQAQGPVVLSDEQDTYRVGRNAEILEDREKVWTIGDVTSPAVSSLFKTRLAPVSNLGHSKSAYWFRLRI